MPIKRRALAACGGMVLCIAGCEQATSTQSGAAPALLSVEEILTRCAAAHGRLNSLTARGQMRDLRQGARRVMPIRWDLARPDRCRLELGDDLIVVSGEQWWSYRAESGRIFRHRPFTRTPIETAANLISDGAPMPLAALWERGEAALHAPGQREGPTPWRMEGVAWLGHHPCYVLSQRVGGQERMRTMRIWIDQDSLLLRGWSLSADIEDGREDLILECTFDELVADARLPSDRFQLKLPPKRASSAASQPM